MAGWNRWQRSAPNKMEIMMSGAALVAILGYFGGLHVLDGRAETYFQDLRGTDPDLYLAQLRDSRSFSAYLDEYRAMRGYDAYKPAAPSFLVGRWTMRPEPLRLTPGTPPGQCTDAVTFDYGVLLMSGGSDGVVPVQYRIEDQTVEVDVESEALDGFTIDLVSYGARLDHVEFQPPGRTETVYAYNCSR